MKTVVLDHTWSLTNEINPRLQRTVESLPSIEDLRALYNDRTLDYGSTVVVLNGLEYQILRTKSWLLYVELL